MPVALRRGIGGDKARGCLRTAATAGSSKKDAADYRIDPTSPGYVDSDVAGEIPHKINTIAETGHAGSLQFQQWCLSCVESLRPRQNQRNLDWRGQCRSQRRLLWRSQQWRRYEGNRELYRRRYRHARQLAWRLRSRWVLRGERVTKHPKLCFPGRQKSAELHVGFEHR